MHLGCDLMRVAKLLCTGTETRGKVLGLIVYLKYLRLVGPGEHVCRSLIELLLNSGECRGLKYSSTLV